MGIDAAELSLAVAKKRHENLPVDAIFPDRMARCANSVTAPKYPSAVKRSISFPILMNMSKPSLPCDSPSHASVKTIIRAMRAVGGR